MKPSLPKHFGTFYFDPGRGEKYYDQRNVCLSVSSLGYLKNTRPRFPNFLYMFPVASDDSAIRYVLPVLWTTSSFHIIEQMGQNQKRCLCFVQFARWRHRGQSQPCPNASC